MTAVDEFAADDNRRIEAPQHRRCHRRCGGFAVRAADCDAVAHPRNLVEHLRPPDDGDFLYPRGDEFRVIRRNRGRYDDDICTVEVRRGVSVVDSRAARAQLLRCL